MKNYSLPKYFAIVGAITFFFFSTMQLIAFALSQKAIKITDSSIFSFISTHYKSLNLILILIILISTITIYLGFLSYTKKNKQPLTKYAVISILIATVIWAIAQYALFVPFFTSLHLTQKVGMIILALTQILFAVALLQYKENRKKALLALCPLFILQALVSLASIATLVQLADFTIAIFIIDAVFFAQEDKKE